MGERVGGEATDAAAGVLRQASEMRTRRARLGRAFRDYEGVTLTRDWIVTYVWDGTIGSESRAVDVEVGELRKRLGKGERIESVPGVGYKLVVPPSAARGA